MPVAKRADHVRSGPGLVALALRFRAVGLVLFSCVTILLCLKIPTIRMPEDPSEAMIPPGHPFYPVLKAIQAMEPRSDRLVGVLEVRAGDIYNKETIEKVCRITRKLLAREWIQPGGFVSLCQGLNHYENTAQGLVGEPILGRGMPETKEDLDEVRRRVAVNPLGIGSFVSYDGTATLFAAKVTTVQGQAENTYRGLSDEEQARVPFERVKRQRERAFYRELLETVRELRSEEEDGIHRLCFVGESLVAATMASMAEREIPLALAAMVVILIVCLALWFRSLAGVVVPLTALVFSILWALGLLGAARGELNPMAVLFPLVLGMIALVLTVLAMTAYDRLQAGSQDKHAAIVLAYATVPVLPCLVTAGLVLFSLWVAGVPLIRQLGLVSVSWLVGAFAVVMIPCPILLSLLPSLPLACRRPLLTGVFDQVARALRRVDGAWGGRGGRILLAAVLLAGGLSAWRLQPGGNVPGASYLRSKDPCNQCLDLLASKFNGPYTLLAYVRAKKEGGLLDPEAINEMGGFSTYMKCEGPARESIAFDWVVKLARVGLMDGNPKWWTVPASKARMKSLAQLLTFPGGLEILVGKHFSQGTIVNFLPEGDARHIDAYLAGMQAYIDSHPSRFFEVKLAGGLLGQVKAINDGALDAYVKSLSCVFVVVLFAGLIATRSVRSSLVLLLALVGGQAVVWMIMVATGTGISLAVTPAAVAGIAFGAMLGWSALRGRTGRQGASRGPGGEALKPGESAEGAIQFAGVLVLASMVPWFFVGLSFHGEMMRIFGITALLEAVAVVLFVSPLVQGGTAGSVLGERSGTHRHGTPQAGRALPSSRHTHRTGLPVTSPTHRLQ